MRNYRPPWGDAPQLDRIPEQSLGTSSLIALMANSTERCRGDNANRLASALILRDFVNYFIEKVDLPTLHT